MRELGLTLKICVSSFGWGGGRKKMVTTPTFAGPSNPEGEESFLQPLVSPGNVSIYIFFLFG